MREGKGDGLAHDKCDRPLLLVGNYALDNQLSMARYAALIRRGLSEAGHEVCLWLPPAILGRWVPRRSRLFKWLAYVDKLVFAPLALLFVQKGFGRVHICDHSNAFYAFVVWCRRRTATCHDVIAIQAARGLVPGWRVGRMGRAYQRLIAAGLGHCQAVYCDSQHTRHDLLALGILAPARVAVSLNAVDQAFVAQPPPGALAASALLQETLASLGSCFVLHVGSDLPRKNRALLFAIFSRLVQHAPYSDSALLLVGPPPSPQQAIQLQALGVADRVHAVAGLTDAELAEVYRRAQALIFPSLQEGFGWPVVEALGCGCPVFATRLQPMLEVGGDAAVYFDPDDADAAASTILQATLESMRTAGPAHAQRYTLGAATAALLA